MSEFSKRTLMTRLSVTPDQFSALGTRVVSLATEYINSLPALRATPEVTVEEIKHALGGPLPEDGLGEHAFDLLPEVMRMSRPTGPRFFGYILGSSEPVAAYADFLSAVLQQNVTAWRSGPSAIAIERIVIEWLAKAVGCDGFAGSLCGGGSSANLMALAMAREAKMPANEDGVRPGIVYATAETHMSTAKAVALLGIGRRNLREVRIDDAFRMDPGALEESILADLRAGLTPMAIVASAGTTATGSVDDFNAIADIAAKYDLWLHIDGAYGGVAAMVLPELFSGLSRADSLSLDPHKWLYQPLSCGCLLYRDRASAIKAFSHTAEYTKTFTSDPDEGFAFFEESIELSRSFRALKLWLSFRYHGLAAYRASIATDIKLALHLHDRIEAHPDLELLAPVPLSAVCFRHKGKPQMSQKELNEFNSAVLIRVLERGRVVISNAELHGSFALRACVVNHRTQVSDVDAVIEEVLAAAAELLQ